MTTNVLLILNGLTNAALLFVLGSGLTLAFGLMRVVNLGHGGFYLLGGYVGYAVFRATESWLLALLAAGASVGLLGLFFERFLLERVRGQPLPETLLTVAMSTIISRAMWCSKDLLLRKNFRAITHHVTYTVLRLPVLKVSASCCLRRWHPKSRLSHQIYRATGK